MNLPPEYEHSEILRNSLEPFNDEEVDPVEILKEEEIEPEAD